MKICYIADAIVPSRKANSIHVMKMCQAYSRLGHAVTLVLPDWKHNLEPGIEDVYKYYGVDQNFDIRKVPLFRFSAFKVLHRSLLMPVVAMLARPDLCHTRSISVAWGLTRLLGIPSILEIHGVPNIDSRLQTMFRHLVGSRNLRLLVTLTHALANHIRPFVPKATPLTVAPDGVDSKWLEWSISAEEARKQIGLNQENLRIAIYAGHLYPGRGIELILELASYLPSYLFLIVGGRDEDVNLYRRRADSLMNVRLLGFKPPQQVFFYLRAADVLLMPYGPRVGVIRGGKGGDSSSFISPMKMFEYMAAGRPILASTLPVLQEVLKDDLNSLLLPFDQPTAWRDALERLAYDTQLATRLSQQAFLDAQQYTWEARARRLMEQVTSKNSHYEKLQR